MIGTACGEFQRKSAVETCLVISGVKDHYASQTLLVGSTIYCKGDKKLACLIKLNNLAFSDFTEVLKSCMVFQCLPAFPALCVGTARMVSARHRMLAHCSVGLDLRPAIHACCCSCFRQRLLAAYPGDCLLSIGCRTD